MTSRTRSNNPLLNLAVAVACGAAAMYFLDPASGRRRRAYVRDKAAAGRHDVADYANTQAKRTTLTTHWSPNACMPRWAIWSSVRATST